MKEDVIKAAASSEVFGCLADEVTDILVLQQFVFVKYVNASGLPQTHVLHTEHMTHTATEQEGLKKIVENSQPDLKKIKSYVTEGARAIIGSSHKKRSTRSN